MKTLKKCRRCLQELPLESLVDLSGKFNKRGASAPLLNKEGNKGAFDTTPLEAEIDRLVYGLYGLTEEEIGVVEGR